MKILALLCLLGGVHAFAQTFSHDTPLKLNKRNQGYEYVSRPFPDGVKVFQLDKTPHVLKIEGLTVVQVWNLRNAARQELWKDMRDIEQAYKDKGLTTYSINFENGTSATRQREALQAFFKDKEQPSHLYYDNMGYVTDLLQVPGFPVYYLVTPGGQIVFSTLGEDPNGVALLKQEIEKRLNP